MRSGTPWHLAEGSTLSATKTRNRPSKQVLNDGLGSRKLGALCQDVKEIFGGQGRGSGKSTFETEQKDSSTFSSMCSLSSLGFCLWILSSVQCHHNSDLIT